MEQKLAIPPLEVKASIKLVRWVCLVSGIIYGIVKKREYRAIEKVLREEEERERPEREARELREKLRRNAGIIFYIYNIHNAFCVLVFNLQLK